MIMTPHEIVKPQVLVVDDEAGMRTALEVTFARRGWQVDAAGGKKEALTYLKLRKHSLVVTDIRMPDGDGFEVMRAARERSPQTAVILLTAFGSVPDAVAAMKSGACEYLVKPVPLEQLLQTAERICSVKNSRSCAMVGSSPALVRALDQARQAARSDADILIEAESGTGKELLAHMVHSLSSRAGHPFIAINCAGIPESLLESDLFGQVAGQVCTLANPTWQEVQLNLALAQAPTWPAAASGWIRSVADAPANVSLEWQLSAALNTALAAAQPEQKSAASSGKNVFASPDPARLGFFMDLELDVTLRFGGCNMLLKDILQLGPGSVLELDREIQDPADLLLDGKLIAKGEVVVVEGNYGLRITEVLAGSRVQA